jgi:hypothetical protein
MTMDTVADGGSADVDLDALMVRVREAAMTSTPTVTPSGPPAPTADLTGSGFDLVRVIEAQGEWNEHTKKSFAAVVSSLRALRDDWADAHARICQEVERLAAVVDGLHPVNQKHARRKATRPRVPITRRRRGAANGRRP